MGHMTILCIDGYNFLHRARSGFQLGDHNVIFNLVRNLRAEVERHKPSRVYFVLEGSPIARLTAMPTYKANRVVVEGSAKHKSLVDFHRQKDMIIDLLSTRFPVSVIHHPTFEGDDVIYNLIRQSTSAVDWTVVSSDTDFIQLLGTYPNVRLYNPITKQYVKQPDYDYLTWKALRGDATDNIPGLPGIGDKTAEAMVLEPGNLQMKKLFEDKSKADHFSYNYMMIRFHDWSDEEAMRMTSSQPTKDWDNVARLFEAWQFKSILKEGTWQKFMATFDPLFGQ